MSNSKKISASADLAPPESQQWIFLENKMPKIGKIPSPKCQTLLYKSAMEHLWGREHFASFVLISETFRNSSFGANLLMNFTVGRQIIPLFNHIITPTSCLSLQFVRSLTIDAEKFDDGAQNFATQMVNTKYLRRQLQSLTIYYARNESLISCFFDNSSPEKNWTQLTSLYL